MILHEIHKHTQQTARSITLHILLQVEKIGSCDNRPVYICMYILAPFL